MKKLLPFLLLILCLSVKSQVKTFSPQGTRISLTPATGITNSTTETTLFSDVIAANSLVLGKYYPFRIDLAVTTPVINLSNLTIRIKYGSQTVSIINAAALSLNLSTATPVTILGYLVSRGNANQFIPVSINQASGTAINLTTTNTISRGVMTVDATVDQTFSITAQFGGLGGNACSLSVDWILRESY